MVKKTLFKLILSLALFFSILPTTVMAEDTVHFSSYTGNIDDFTELLNTTTAKNIVVDDFLLVDDGKTHVFDFSGHTVTCKNVYIEENSKATFSGSTSGRWIGNIRIYSGNLIINNGYYECDDTVITIGGDSEEKPALPSATINGGTFVGLSDSEVLWFFSGNLKINNGNFTSKNGDVIFVYNTTSRIQHIESLVINGGTFTVENTEGLNQMRAFPLYLISDKEMSSTSIVNPATSVQNGQFKKTKLAERDVLYIDIAKWVVTGKPATIVTSATSYPYTGSSIKPAVTIKDAFGKVIPASNYTVAYSNNKAIGTATIKVTFKGIYTGTLTKRFTITPKKMTIKSISKGKNYLTVKWNKDSKAKGYQIRYSTKSDMSGAKTVTISKYKTTSKKISKLKRKTKYYVQIRSYATVSGKKIYSTWSSAKTAKTK